MRLKDLLQIFPDAKFINIVRDPRDVISSAKGRIEREGHFDFGVSNKNNSNSTDNNFIQQSSLAYKQITNEIYKFSIQEKNVNFLTIKYEDLNSNPTKIILQILHFCELEIPASIEEITPKIREAQKKWEESLTETDQKQISKILKTWLQKMNYPYKL